jgi:hypothetical protein
MGIGVIALQLLISTLDGGEWSASRPGRFTSEEGVAQYPLDRRIGAPSRSGHCGVKQILLFLLAVHGS